MNKQNGKSKRTERSQEEKIKKKRGRDAYAGDEKRKRAKALPVTKKRRMRKRGTLEKKGVEMKGENPPNMPNKKCERFCMMQNLQNSSIFRKKQTAQRRLLFSEE